MFKCKTHYYCPRCQKGVNKFFVRKDKLAPYPLYIHATCGEVVKSIQKNVVPMTNH